MYDYGQRQYLPDIGRFNRLDRFSEKYFDKSVYSYAANNPIKYIDIMGDSIVIPKFEDRKNILKDINSLAKGNFDVDKKGNLKIVSLNETKDKKSVEYRDQLLLAIRDPDKISYQN